MEHPLWANRQTAVSRMSECRFQCWTARSSVRDDTASPWGTRQSTGFKMHFRILYTFLVYLVRSMQRGIHFPCFFPNKMRLSYILLTDLFWIIVERPGFVLFMQKWNAFYANTQGFWNSIRKNRRSAKIIKKRVLNASRNKFKSSKISVDEINLDLSFSSFLVYV